MRQDRRYTVLILADHSSRIRQLQLTSRKILRLGVMTGLFLIALIVASARWIGIAAAADESAPVREENAHLRRELSQLRERVARVGATLDEVERLDQRLRSVSLRDGAELEPERDSSKGDAVSTTASPVNALDAEARRQRLDLQGALRHFEERAAPAAVPASAEAPEAP